MSASQKIIQAAAGNSSGTLDPAVIVLRNFDSTYSNNDSAGSNLSLYTLNFQNGSSAYDNNNNLILTGYGQGLAIASFDVDGNLNWLNNFNNSSKSRILCIDENNNIYLSCVKSFNNSSLSTTSTIIKINSSGTILWSATIRRGIKYQDSLDGFLKKATDGNEYLYVLTSGYGNTFSSYAAPGVFQFNASTGSLVDWQTNEAANSAAIYGACFTYDEYSNSVIWIGTEYPVGTDKAIFYKVALSAYNGRFSTINFKLEYPDLGYNTFYDITTDPSNGDIYLVGGISQSLANGNIRGRIFKFNSSGVYQSNYSWYEGGPGTGVVIDSGKIYVTTAKNNLFVFDTSLNLDSSHFFSYEEPVSSTTVQNSYERTYVRPLIKDGCIHFMNNHMGLESQGGNGGTAFVLRIPIDGLAEDYYFENGTFFINNNFTVDSWTPNTSYVTASSSYNGPSSSSYYSSSTTNSAFSAYDTTSYPHSNFELVFYNRRENAAGIAHLNTYTVAGSTGTATQTSKSPIELKEHDILMAVLYGSDITWPNVAITSSGWTSVVNRNFYDGGPTYKYGSLRVYYKIVGANPSDADANLTFTRGGSTTASVGMHLYLIKRSSTSSGSPFADLTYSNSATGGYVMDFDSKTSYSYSDAEIIFNIGVILTTSTFITAYPGGGRKYHSGQSSSANDTYDSQMSTYFYLAPPSTTFDANIWGQNSSVGNSYAQQLVSGRIVL